MNFLSLFSGIGGFDLGLERAGMKCIGQVEINAYCQRVLKYHWPHVKLIGNIHDVKKTDFEKTDLICGGFPCQPFSYAGNRRGAKDDRYLWPEMLRVIKAYRPAWVLGENVAGIINMELDNVLSDLERESYEVQAFIIPACAVDAPHERKRVWIVAHSTAWQNDRRERRVMAEAEGRGKGFNAATFACSENVPDPNGSGFRKRRRAKSVRSKQCSAERIGKNASDADCYGHDKEEGYATEQGRHEPKNRIFERGNIWRPEPCVGRLADGIPDRVAQLRALGNAVVPQVVEEIGKAILETERKMKCITKCTR